MVANPLNVRACRYRVATVALAVLVAVFAARLALAHERPASQEAAEWQVRAQIRGMDVIGLGSHTADHSD